MSVSARAARRLAGVAVAAACGAASLSSAGLALSAPSAASVTPARARPCAAADLGVWAALDQAGAAAGTVYYPLEFTNDSHRTCTLSGFPRVSAIGRRGQRLGDPARWDNAVTPSTVRLVPGATGYALLEYSDVVTSNCPSAAAHGCRTAGLSARPAPGRSCLLGPDGLHRPGLVGVPECARHRTGHRRPGRPGLARAGARSPRRGGRERILAQRPARSGRCCHG